MVPETGSYVATNSEGSLIVLIAAKARIRDVGKASASLFAAPSRVAPRVTMSSTKRISFGGGSEILPCRLIVSMCSLGFGLTNGSAHAAFLRAVARTRHATTSLPSPISARAVAILSGTQRVPGRIRELPGTGTRTVLGWKKEANGNCGPCCWTVLAIHCDMGICGCSSTNPSLLMASITSLAWSFSPEFPRGE